MPVMDGLTATREIRAFLEKMHVRLLNHIILSEDAGANKPSQQFFDFAFQRSAASPATTLMIGDNLQTDILGAKQAGLPTAFFNRFPEFPAPEPVDYEITSLKQLMEIL